MRLAKAGRQIRDGLRRIPPLVAAKRLLFPNPDGLAGQSKIEVLRAFAAFIPYSAGGYRDRARLTVQAIQDTLPALERVARAVHQPIEIEDLTDLQGGEAVDRLGALFDRYGSDKTRLSYHRFYASILVGQVTCIVEIGLGSNNEDVVSNMGSAGRPGASLRAFRDFAVDADVVGGDIDARILFIEERIKTAQVDQTSADSLGQFVQALDGPVDLFIDDGLHSPHANLLTLSVALPILKPGGWCVIEDIGGPALPLWQSVALMLENSHHCRILRSGTSYLFAAQRSR